jgi:putative transposase
MPWKEQRTMSLKLEFVDRALRPGARVSALCREFGISRQTGHKWLNRFKRDGADGLEEGSRRPKGCSLATAEDVVLAILAIRDKHPRRGPKKLVRLLRPRFGAETPSVATVARVLRRFGMVRQKGKFRRISIVERAPTLRAAGCNDIWTVDFKGWWRSLDGERCEPLTVRDAHSRYILAVKVFETPAMEPVRKAFLGLFRRHGVPRHIQCDNGNPFINVQARGGLTRLSAWWVSLGITVVRSRRGCPQDNGAHERMHRDMREDLQASPSASRVAQQRDCDRWRQEFNRVRPHEALQGKVPAEVYKRSERLPHISTYLYPPGWIVRTTTRTGVLNVDGNQLNAGLALGRQRVALEPLGGLNHRMWFREVDLGCVELCVSDLVVDEAVEKYLARRTKTRPRRAA